MSEAVIASAKTKRPEKIEYKKTIFGYTPKWTVFSNLHPLARFSLLLIYNVPFFIVNPFINLVFLVSVILLYRIARIPSRYLKTFLPFGITLSITLVITYAFFASIFIKMPYQYPLFHIGTWGYHYENLLVTFMMWLRWMSAIFGALFIFAITDERDINLALKAVGTPFFLRLAIATGLRSFFSFYYDALQIIEAQKARGLDLENMPALKRLRYYIAVAVPLIMIELKRADEMSDAADARGYVAFSDTKEKGKKEQRSEFIGRDVIITGKDRAVIAFALILFFGAIVCSMIPAVQQVIGWFPASPAELAALFGL
ncbi:MAG: energy-coupling factor transporter transmembrane component T [Bacillota bacterium]